MEQWKIIPEFPRYSVSDQGRVRRDQTGRIMKLEVNQFEVVTVGMMGGSGMLERQYKRSVPLLVAQAFVPNKYTRHFDTPICVDGDRMNVSAENLDWRPRWFAVQYNQQFKRRYHSPIHRPIRDLKTGEVYMNSIECCKVFGLLEKDLVLSILNRTYVWPTYQEFEIFQPRH